MQAWADYCEAQVGRQRGEAGGRARGTRTRRDRPASRQSGEHLPVSLRSSGAVARCAMSDRFTFWLGSGSWPRDHGGAVFLARAANEVGQAMYPKDWTGREAVTPEPYGVWISWPPGSDGTPAPQKHQATWLVRRVRGLLVKHQPDLLIPAPGEIRRQLSLTPEQWSAGCEIARTLDAEQRPARMRFAAVLRKVRDALADGHLISILRDPKGGSYSPPVSADLWNIEDEQLDRRLNSAR